MKTRNSTSQKLRPSAARELKTVAVIPARMASSRFPGKPLASICGLPMIEHVRRRVALCKDIQRIIVATCDQEIMDVVCAQGGEAMMTSSKHERGTDRIAEVAAKLDVDVVINVQGDEPLVRPEQLKQLLEAFYTDSSIFSVNAIAPIDTDEDFESPHVVKTVLDRKGFALYFSREAIPSRKKFSRPFDRFKQLGLIAFKREFLMLFSRLQPTFLEEVESVDMMRALEHGYPVKTVITKFAALGVDTPEDLERAQVLMSKDDLLCGYHAAAAVRL